MSLGKIEIVRRLKGEDCIEKLKSLGVNSMLIFGSVLTDEFTEYSDVDVAILSNKLMKLNTILEIEEYLEKYLEREIDVINLMSEDLDLAMKVTIYDNGLLIYNDELNLYEKDYFKTETKYKDNETFRFFRERDVIWSE